MDSKKNLKYTLLLAWWPQYRGKAGGAGRWWNLTPVTAIQSSLRNHDHSPKGSRRARGRGEQPSPSRGSSRPGPPRPPRLQAPPRLASPGGFAPLPGLGQARRARPGGEGEGTGRSLRAAPGQEVLPVVMGRSAPTASLQREFCSLAAWAWVHAQTTTKRTSAE